MEHTARYVEDIGIVFKNYEEPDLAVTSYCMTADTIFDVAEYIKFHYEKYVHGVLDDAEAFSKIRNPHHENVGLALVREMVCGIPSSVFTDLATDYWVNSDREDKTDDSL